MIDYENSIISVTHSILKYYNKNYNRSIKEIDDLIEDTKHVALILLDGLGINILQKHLNNNSFLKKHLVKEISSVYPPTTVAATTSVLTGKTPSETLWIGWHQYFKELNDEIVMFQSNGYYSNKIYQKNYTYKVLPVKEFYKDFNVTTNTIYPRFKENGYKNFKSMLKALLNIQNKNKETFTYLYYDEPDSTIHKYGTSHKKVKKVVRKIDNLLSKYLNKATKDTLFIIIADHGLIDVNYFNILDYPDFYETLDRKPSIESRTTSFKVNDHQKFLELFDKYFGKYFTIYNKDEFLKSGMLGSINTDNPFIDDYVSIAIDKYAFKCENRKEDAKATHAGFTNDELMVPLVLFKK